MTDGVGLTGLAWGLADKIAVIASLLSFLQFLALVATVWAMVRNGRRQLRAYVFVDHGSFELMTTDKSRLFIRGLVSVKNYGQTPGYEFVTSTKMDVFDAKSPSFNEDYRGLGKSIIGPGSERDISVIKGPIDEADLVAIRAGTKSIFIWGRIDYIDAFKKKRYLKFYNMSGREILVPGVTPSGRWPIYQADKPYDGN